MRNVKLTGREISIVRAIGFAEPTPGVDLVETTRMDPEDVADAVNGLMAAGFVETIPYREQIEPAEVPAYSYEVNPAYVGQLRTAMLRR